MRNMRLVKVIGRMDVGGSCAECNGDYSSPMYPEENGYRVLLEDEEGIVEPYNLCGNCKREYRK